MLCLMSCSTRELTPGLRPADPAGDTKWLDDSSMRIVSSAITLRYADGGILFSRSDGGAVTAVRIDDGCTVAFDASAASLSVNGAELTVTACRLAARSGATEWYCMTASELPDPIMIVIDGL